MPDERYFSMPSAEVGGDVRRNRALNCWPWVRSLTHSPEAVIHSPAEMVATWPTTVTTSRCPRALARRTQKPFSALPGSMILAVDSCGLSRSCVAPIENAEDVLRWNFGAAECRIFVRTPLPRANPSAIAGAARIRHGRYQSPCLSVHVYWTVVGHQLTIL